MLVRCRKTASSALSKPEAGGSTVPATALPNFGIVDARNPDPANDVDLETTKNEECRRADLNRRHRAYESPCFSRKNGILAETGGQKKVTKASIRSLLSASFQIDAPETNRTEISPPLLDSATAAPCVSNELSASCNDPEAPNKDE
jgi:hypothetical protein